MDGRAYQENPGPINLYVQTAQVFRRIYQLEDGSQLNISFWHDCVTDEPTAYAYLFDRHVRLHPGLNVDVLGSKANITWSVKVLSMDSFVVRTGSGQNLGYEEVKPQSVRCIKLPLGESSGFLEPFQFPADKPGEIKRWSLVAIVVILLFILLILSK